MNTDKATIDTLDRRPVVTCRRCGRELTEPDSYASGIGPICAARLMVCQKELARLNMAMDPALVAAAMDDGPSIISLNAKGDRLILQFRFDEDGQVRRGIKAIAGWNFDYNGSRQWSVPACGASLEAAMAALPQARIYVGDLERINALPQLPAAPKFTEIPTRKAWLDGTTASPMALLSWDRRDRDFQAILTEVKECPGRRWNPDRFHWSALPSQQLMALLDKWGFEITGPLAEYLDQFKPKEIGEIELPPGLKLYRFQVDGLKFLESRRGRALIADEMGLGKTIQALAWLRMHPEARPAVVVVPASLKLNWRREANKWCPGEPVVVLGGRAGSDPSLLLELASHATKGRGNKAIIVVNYDILASNGKAGWAKVLKTAMDIKAVVIDESHYIKNQKAQRTQAVRELAKGVPHVIAMSGTPIINRPIEFYNAISLVNPTVFPSWYKYASRYCAPKFNGFAIEYTGASNTKELHHILTNPETGVMIRRLKKDVLKDLPAKIRSVVPLELENRREYGEAVQDFLGWLAKTEGQEAADRAAGAEALVAIGKLKQLAARGKIQAAIGWIRDVVEQDEKIIVFAVHHWVIDRLMEEFGPQAVRLTGKESQRQRQEAVDRFQNDDSVQVFVGNIKAAGLGLNLQISSYVAFVELDWQPAAHFQAEDRAHRIGQEFPVNIYYLVAEGTIEEDIATMLTEKEKVLSAILDGKPVKEEGVFGLLLKKLREKVQA